MKKILFALALYFTLGLHAESTLNIPRPNHAPQEHKKVVGLQLTSDNVEVSDTQSAGAIEVTCLGTMAHQVKDRDGKVVGLNVVATFVGANSVQVSLPLNEDENGKYISLKKYWLKLK